METRLTFAEICRIIDEEVRNAEKVQKECKDLLDEIMFFLDDIEDNNVQFHNWFCGISYHPSLTECPVRESLAPECFQSFDCGTEEYAKRVERLFLALGMTGMNKKRSLDFSKPACRYVYFHKII